MLDLSRRGVVHVIVIALIAAALAPQAVAATPPDSATYELLAAVEASPAATLAPRGTTSLRSSAEFNLVAGSASSVPDGAEHIASGLGAPPSVTMQATIVGSPLQSVARPGGGATISGSASWYCCTRGWGDAAVVALPIALGGHYYSPPGGFSVVVCADRCARIAVGDACGCHWGQVGQKVVDLSPAAWAAITDKDRFVYGIVAVTVYLD